MITSPARRTCICRAAGGDNQQQQERNDMGWSIGFDSKWNRDIGYGVPATCDYPRLRRGH